MASQGNNPIVNTIRDVLGIGDQGIRSFKDKVDALSKLQESSPLIKELVSPDVTRKLNLSKPLVVFDLETTGLNVNQDQIFDAHFLKINPDGTVDRFSQKIRPNVPISKKAAKLTGVSQQQLDTYGTTFKDIGQKLKTFIGDADLAGYNGLEFDIPLLRKEFARAGINFNLTNRNVIDVFKLVQARYPDWSTKFPGKKMTLGEVFETVVGSPLTGAHGAEVDVEKATVPLLNKLLQTTDLPQDVPGLAKISEQSRKMLRGPIQNISDVIRADKFSMLEGFTAYSGKDITSLYTRLRQAEALPSEAAPFFRGLRKAGATVYFDEATRGMFFGKDLASVKMGTGVTAIPLAKEAQKGLAGMVQLGTQARSALSAAIVDDGGNTVLKSFLSLFYGELEGQVTGGSVYELSRQVKQTFSKEIANLGKIKTLLKSSYTTRGISTAAAESAFDKEKYVLGFISEDPLTNPLYASLKGYRSSLSALSMLIKTGGRSIFNELGLPADATPAQALSLINKLGRDYLGPKGKLATFLTEQGMINAVPYVKPEYLGQKRIMAGGMELVKRFGSFFEEKVLTKGLFQLAKASETTNVQTRAMLAAGENPFTPYILAEDLNATGKTRNLYRKGKIVKTIVAEAEDQATSMLYFGESGAYYTEAGERAILSRVPKGTIKIPSPSLYDIERAERLFGVNIGESPTKFFETGINVQYSYKEYKRALDRSIKFKELSSIEKDIRVFASMGGKKYAGLLGQLASRSNKPESKLAKFSYTESGLTLDFVTGEPMAPTTIESLIGTRRFTVRATAKGNVFYGQDLKGAQVVIGADEFAKMHGQNLLLTNYIGVMNDYNNANAADEFKKVFKFDAKVIARKKGGSFVIPVIKDADDAFNLVRERLKEMRSSSDQKERKLYSLIVEGLDVTDNIKVKGIKSLRQFYTFFAPRTDFMSDINMLKPIRMTLSKMVTLGSAAAQLGYGVGEDPLFKLIAGLSNPWKQGHLKLSSKYGQLELGEDHFLKRFFKSLVTPESIGTLKESQVIKFEDGKFFFTTPEGNKIQLKDLPKGMDRFKYKQGGVPLKDLEGTILDTNLLKSDIMYIDLGKNVRGNLLGAGNVTKEYRYVPVPLGMMRMRGMQGNLILSSKDPAYEIIEDLTRIQEAKTFDPTKPIRYEKLIRKMVGKKGLLAKKSDIMLSFGTRARLSPLAMHSMSVEDLVDEKKLFEATMTQSEFEDFLSRKNQYIRKAPAADKSKKSIHNAVLDAISESVAKKGYFMASIGVDPMQRAEHMNVFKINVVKDTENKFKAHRRRIGQLNLQLHPLIARMVERDLDKDVANLLPLEGLTAKGIDTPEQALQALEARYIKQAQLSKHFLMFSYMQAKAETPPSVASRLAKLIDDSNIFKPVADFLGQYVGTLKSLGYSITRGSESVMSALIDQGAEAAESLGLLKQGFSVSALSEAVSPYMGTAAAGQISEGAERLSVVKKLMQNVFQGAVQKGAEKEPLIKLAEEMVEIGQKYKGAAYDRKASIEKMTDAFERFLTTSDITSKNRAFMAMNYMAERNIGGLTKESVEALNKDLIAQNGIMTQEIRDKFTTVFKQAIRGQAELLGEFFGAAAPIMASVRRSYSGAIGIVQKAFRKGDEFISVAETVIGGVLGKPVNLESSEFTQPSKTQETLLKEVEEQAKKVAGKSTETLAGKVKGFLKTGGGKFALGVGVGAVATAFTTSLFSGPQPPPMPRDIDSRQPMDYGPEVSATAPKIYGNNQVFAASRNRSPESFSSAPRYNFGVGNNTRMVMQDKSSVSNPYVIEQQMRRVAYSDFNY